MSTQDKRATLTIQPETRERLFERKQGPKDTYDAVLNRLLDEQ